jgi:hypothetical protein
MANPMNRAMLATTVDLCASSESSISEFGETLFRKMVTKLKRKSLHEFVVRPHRSQCLRKFKIFLRFIVGGDLTKPETSVCPAFSFHNCITDPMRKSE